MYLQTGLGKYFVPLIPSQIGLVALISFLPDYVESPQHDGAIRVEFYSFRNLIRIRHENLNVAHSMALIGSLRAMIPSNFSIP